MKYLSLYVASMALAASLHPSLGAEPRGLEPYNVTWTEPGKSSADSMPLGNGDIGLNVWTESNGDVLFYISKSDAWTEDVRGSYGLVKLGRVRVTLSPNPFTAGGFVQTLRLADGEVQIQGGVGTNAATLRIWADANHPVVRVEAESASPVGCKVARDPWRTAAIGKVGADVVLPCENNRLVWYHHNDEKGDKQTANWTFGAALQGAEGFLAEGAALHSTVPKTRYLISVYPLTARAGTVEDWKTRLESQIASVDAVPLDKARAAHQRWWNDFWQRSWIYLSGAPKAEEVTRGYVLQRFITACAGRGAYPIKFNGSIFTVDDPAHNFGKDKATGVDRVENISADFRSWGGQYWFQNTRPIYWPLLRAGDFDLMQPLFDMYLGVASNNAALVKQYYGHDGSYLAETASFYGGIGKLTPESPGSYTAHYYTPILELSAMMLDYYAYTQDEKFAREKLLPLATAGLTFFDRHFPRDKQGRLLLDPDNAIEMYWKVRNPLPDIAGLHYVLERLLALPAGLVEPATRGQWERLQRELPPVPVGLRNGQKTLLPYAEGQEHKAHNSENPELYAVYPFRLYGRGKPDLEVARAAFANRTQKGYHCWGQDPVQAALLGLADEAQKGVVKNLTNKDKRLRFPAFWDKGHDYEPDQCNGGNGQQALQLMLMQCDGQRILLLPAWPSGWDADFKLCAPQQTTIQGQLRGGKLIQLVVTPESRRRDVVLTESVQR